MKYILIGLIFPFMIYGQLNQNTLIPGILPQNPQVYQFLNYGETSINSYTGTPEISIPIYTIEAKGLNIPISLNYNSNGIKVNEESSWVGLGWNLNTDFQIVQSVRGLDDFGRYQRHFFPDLNCIIPKITGGMSSNNVLGSCNNFFITHDDNSNKDGSNCSISPSYTAGIWDSEPDIFYFNAAGYSGKFVLDWANEKFICLTDKNIIIESGGYELNAPSQNNIPSDFTIIVPDGHRFYFFIEEVTKINHKTSDGELRGVPTNVQLVGETSARVFKLHQIVTNKGEVINFYYEKSSKVTNGAITDLVSKNFPDVNDIFTTFYPSSGSNFVPDGVGHTISYLATEQVYSYLKTIERVNETVSFITSLREDIKEARKLDKIVVNYRNSYKNFNFGYDYFTSNNLGNNWDSFLMRQGYNCEKNSNEISKRLKLISFLNAQEKPHIFEYNSQSLPSKTSYATDYWGYYNGMHTNTSFYPNIYLFNIERENTHYLQFQNNNNNPTLEYCKAGILEKIKYPTGGYTLYDYELNRFNNYVVPAMYKEPLKSINITTIPFNIAGKKNDEVVLIEGGSIICRGSATLSVQGCYPQYPQAHNNCYVRLIHFKKEFIPIVKSVSGYATYGLRYALETIKNSNLALYNANIDSDSQVLTKVANGINEETFSNLEYILKEGIAYFMVSGGCGTFSYGSTSDLIGNSSQATLNLTYTEYKPLTGESFGGGLRIKSIKNYSDINVITHHKEYQYDGGKLMTPLVYLNKTLQNLTSQRIIGTSDYCPLNADIAALNVLLSSAWQDFSSNPTSANINKVNSILNSLVQKISESNCTSSLISSTMFFHGFKNVLSSQGHIAPSKRASGNYVGYDKVTELDIAINSDTLTIKPTNGKIVYHFKNNSDVEVAANTGIGYQTEINMPPTMQYPENGLLEKQEVFDSKNDIKREITNTYSSRMQQCFWGMKNITTDYFAQTMPGTEVQRIIFKYLDGFYPIKAGRSLLDSKEIKYFENGKELMVSSIYKYDNANQLSRIEEKKSNGEIVFTYNFYPYDFPDEYSGLISRNMISPIIKTYKSINQVPYNLEKKFYANYSASGDGNFFSPKYLVKKVQFAKSGNENDLDDQIKFISYDIYGNPQQVVEKGDNGINTAYIWGYNGLYPIAKLENGYSNNILNSNNTSTITST